MNNKVYMGIAEAYSEIYTLENIDENYLIERTPVIGADGKPRAPQAPATGWWTNFGQRPKVSGAGAAQRTGPRGTGINPSQSTQRPSASSATPSRPTGLAPKLPNSGRVGAQPTTQARPPVPGPKPPARGTATPPGLPKVPPQGTSRPKAPRPSATVSGTTGSAAPAPRPTAPAPRPAAPAPSRPAAAAPAAPAKPTAAPKPATPTAPVQRMKPLGQDSRDSIFSRGTSMSPEQGRSAFLSKMSTGSEKKTGVKKEDMDIFDLIMNHLIEEGFCYSEQEALVLMSNMSEEWRSNILAHYGIQLEEGITAGSTSREYAVNREKMIKSASEKLKKGGMSKNDSERLKGYLQSDRRERKISGDKYSDEATAVRQKARAAKAAKMASERRAKEAEDAKPQGMMSKAKSALKKFLKREEYDYVIDYILDEGYSYEESIEIFEELDAETIVMILEELEDLVEGYKKPNIMKMVNKMSKIYRDAGKAGDKESARKADKRTDKINREVERYEDEGPLNHEISGRMRGFHNKNMKYLKQKINPDFR